mgnify:CR=1 FL=1
MLTKTSLASLNYDLFSVLLKTEISIFYGNLDLIMILLKLTQITCIIK